MEGVRNECDKEGAIRWAKKNGFSDNKLPEFKSMLALIQSTYIDRKELEEAVFLDKGAFGAIDRAVYHGTVCRPSTNFPVLPHVDPHRRN